MRRLTDRPVSFRVHLRFEEERLQKGEEHSPLGGGTLRTKIRVAIAPRRNRDRRRADVTDRARQVLASFRSYLMASEEEATPSRGVLTSVKRLLGPWLEKRGH